ncbi:WXG100 family type VII secretion target [Nocardia sp. NPDC127579]|uniref:WXG100 family type VII secretion target n=1 Tax=Nocardia sp. NPDC127579 TaxID=3345402 RepID=UPI0036432336
MSKPISANFEGVEAGAQQIVKRGREIGDELQAFHQKVDAFFQTQGGAAKEAAQQFQATWNQHVQQLNETLSGAGTLVSTGNSELQNTDTAMANLF